MLSKFFHNTILANIVVFVIQIVRVFTEKGFDIRQALSFYLTYLVLFLGVYFILEKPIKIDEEEVNNFKKGV